ncbi:MAG: LicD family protein [Fibrobacter sp.]|nr:LicD family protein [Fibrobacter sp.]
MKEMSMQEQRDMMLDILKDIHAFCEKENIMYSLAYGSLIGAIRHQGFIPWDDDIDICMPRLDYERFIKSYKSDKYDVAFCGEGCKYDCLIAYARVFDKKETIAKNAHWISERTGLWIDVFPLDGVPEDPKTYEALFEEMRKEWERIIPKKVQFTRITDQQGIKNKLRLLKKKIKLLNGLGGHKMQRVFNKKMVAIPYEGAKYYSNLAVLDGGLEHIPAETFQETILIKFEDTYFRAMKGYDLMLKTFYGNYMELPPEEKRIPHQSYIRFYWKNK